MTLFLTILHVVLPIRKTVELFSQSFLLLLFLLVRGEEESVLLWCSMINSSNLFAGIEISVLTINLKFTLFSVLKVEQVDNYWKTLFFDNSILRVSEVTSDKNSTILFGFEKKNVKKNNLTINSLYV